MAKAKKAARPARKRVAKKASALDLGKFLDEVKIGKYKLEDVLDGTGKNLQAIADANRAIVDGYIDIAKRQYEMLKSLLDDLKKVGGDRSDMAKELRKLVDQAKKDLQILQKMAAKTNSAAQKIVKKRSDANLRTWKKLVADARKSLGKKGTTAKKPAAKKKAAAKKKPAAKKRAAAKKKTVAKKRPAARKKAAPRKKTAAS